MFKTNIFCKLMLIILTCLSSLSSCNLQEPKQPTDETKNKLHEDPFKAIITLQAGTLSSSTTFEEASLQNFVPLKEEIQTMIWETSKLKGWHISERGCSIFQVLSHHDRADLVYLLRINYYNAQGELMNAQFIENGQDQIHQHFFSIYKDQALVRDPKQIPYEYSYQDSEVWNDDTSRRIGKTNPMGFKGFIRFKEAQPALTLAIELVHAFTSKYERDGSTNPFYFSGRRLRGSEGSFDISIQVPFTIGKKDGKPTEPKDKPIEKKPEKKLGNRLAVEGFNAVDKTEVRKLVVKMYEGHLHGSKNFHYVSGPKGISTPFLRYEQELSFEYIGDQWYVQEGQEDKFVVFASKMYRSNINDENSPLLPAPVYGCWLEYYDAQGQIINDYFTAEGAYQHFFIPRQVRATDQQEALVPNAQARDMLNYVYRDTRPWNLSGTNHTAQFNSEQDPLGLKGFFNFPTLNRKFLLSLQLWQTKGGKLEHHQASPFYQPNKSMRAKGEKLLEVNIPIYVILRSEDKELDESSELRDLNKEDQDRLGLVLRLARQTWAEFIQNIDKRVWGKVGDESEGHWF